MGHPADEPQERAPGHPSSRARWTPGRQARRSCPFGRQGAATRRVLVAHHGTRTRALAAFGQRGRTARVHDAVSAAGIVRSVRFVGGHGELEHFSNFSIRTESTFLRWARHGPPAHTVLLCATFSRPLWRRKATARAFLIVCSAVSPPRISGGGIWTFAVHTRGFISWDGSKFEWNGSPPRYLFAAIFAEEPARTHGGATLTTRSADEPSPHDERRALRVELRA